MSNNYDDIKAKVGKLIIERDRVGKKELSKKKRMKYLNNVYDAALVHLLQCVVAGTTKGTSALCQVLERARLEMVDLDRTSRLTIDIKVEGDIDYSKLSADQLRQLQAMRQAIRSESE